MNYYKQLLKKESETRKYRHDMVNHLVYLQEVLKNDQAENARKYVCTLEKLVDHPIYLVSTGAERDAYLLRE